MNKKISKEKRLSARLMLLEGRSYREIASELQVSVGSIHNIVKETPENLSPLISEIKKRTAIKYWLLSDHILSRISELNLTYATLKDKVIASAILMDKARLIEGEKVKDDNRVDLNNLNMIERSNDKNEDNSST
ncbi:MAG: helix-turn-helix domain-containing protein [Nitrospirae bacterium]|nr:helix-turn-helix domain-containing protein [Nitrospirota bacterium]